MMGQGRIHIVFLNEFYHPDICASAVVAADHLPKIARRRPDWRITVIAGDRAWDDPATVYLREETHDGVRIVRVPRPSLKRASLLRRGFGFAAFGRGAREAARRIGAIDLVIGTTAPPQGGAIARRIARRAGCPYIYKVLDLYPDLAVALGRLREGSFIHRRWLATDRRAMGDAAAVVCIAERMARRVVECRGSGESSRRGDLPAERVVAIHDGYDRGRLTCGGSNDFQRRTNPDGRFVVQYAGNMGLSHPFDSILGAARMLEGDGDVLFQFIGDGPGRASLEASLPPNARVLDFEPAERVGDVLATADVCLISQHQEMHDLALPYKVYTILAAGKPAIFIGSRHSEIADWLTSSGAGMHVEQGDAGALAAAIRELKNDGVKRASMAGAASRLFGERFESSRAVERWVDLIDAVLAR